jgi:amidohydrolase
MCSARQSGHILLFLTLLSASAATASAGAGASGATVPAAEESPDFAALAARHESEVITHRRWLHEHPELSLREEGTQEYLRSALGQVPGVELVEGEWSTGLVALLRGGRPGPLVAWRTDMDGLPITENTGLPFASSSRDTLSGGRVVGVMHACGHDLHMSVALGLVRVLSDLRAEMPGSLLLICEPAEEIGAGALALLEAGVFAEGRRPKCTFALHVHPTIPLGQVGSCPGPSTANVDGFVLTVKGDGGHGAYPHRGVDPVTLAARMVLALQSLVAREIDVNDHAVISVGRIEGGAKSNVIPSEVVIEATVRSQSEETRQLLAEKIERTLNGLAEAAGAPAPVLEYYFGTAAGYNDPVLVEAARQVFRRELGDVNEILYPPPMGGEDFSYYRREAPSFQFRLGVGEEERPMNLHRPDFAPDERAIGLGIQVAAAVVWDQLLRGAQIGD